MVISACITLIAGLAGNLWISCAAIALIFILTFVILWRLINFANKNPQAAILEGAEFLVHEQIQMAAKGLKSMPQSLLTLVEEDPPVKLNNELQQLANQPDEDNNNEEEGNNG
ncbi:hypothetical protein [Flavihumibacter solisilvae]|uniref:Uncharacterized protein n=1 Tax=Flavihumibacter solisilvae TaxID=1349421 RepID=A0A0C1KS36_9BACT|nr:hypothetical protein [Flavihumibacter solisilvae]KIC90266.1 hypothetical protein OI18_23370 [Flavihumibacter solisilvae]